MKAWLKFFWWNILLTRCAECHGHLVLHGYMGGVWSCRKCDFYGNDN
jgi:ribosomal protein L37AE/L43A